MAQYDILVKHIIDLFAHEFVCLALDTPEVEILGRLTTEQPTLKMHHNDVTLKVQLHGGGTAILHEEIMQESPFYESLRQRHLQEGIEQGIEQGIERGARAHAIENTLAVLNARFPGSDVDRVKAILEGVGDLERLKELNLNASLVPSFEVFLRGLDN